MLWDATVGDTVAPSYIHSSAKTPGFVAKKAERRKLNHYIELKKNNYSHPVSFETFGPMGSDTKKFMGIIGKHLKTATGDPRAKDSFLQRISVELQRRNPASILNTSKSDVSKENTKKKFCESKKNVIFLMIKEPVEYDCNVKI